MGRIAVIGHDAVRLTLDRLKKNPNLHHAWHFTGTPGVGKRLIAMDMVQGHLCTDPAGPLEPCGRCSSCVTFLADTHPDFLVLSPDEKGSIKVGTPADNPPPQTVRWLIGRVSRRAVGGKYGVIIDGIDLVTDEGQNALLKFLEEPPAGTLIVVISSSRAGVLPTIRSRCQEIGFNPLETGQVEEILASLGQGGERTPMIAGISGGSMAVALALGDADFFDAVTGFCREIGQFLENGRPPLFETGDMTGGGDASLFIDAVSGLYRFMLRIAAGLDEPILPGDIMINDIDRITPVLKIMLSLRKGLERNLNIRTMVKGMLYTMNSPGRPGIPEPGLVDDGAGALWK